MLQLKDMRPSILYLFVHCSSLSADTFSFTFSNEFPANDFYAYAKTSSTVDVRIHTTQNNAFLGCNRPLCRQQSSRCRA